MSWVAAAVVGGAVVGGVASNMAAGKAASAQKSAAKDANATQQYIYDQTREDQTPWRNAGVSSLSELMYEMGLGDTSDGGSYGDPYADQPLVDQISSGRASGGVVPSTNQALYMSDPVYRRAWDQAANEHMQQFGTGYTKHSNIDAITSRVQQLMTADPEFAKQQEARKASVTHGGEYGSLTKNFSLSDFEADPGYQFRMDEGLKGVQSSAAARGGLLNGGTLKALTKYGQDFASNEYGNAYNRFNNDQTNRFNRLSTIAGVGQTANNAIGAAGSNYANNVSQNQLAVGNANAASAIATGNAINNGVNNVSSYYTMKNLFSNQQAA